MECGSLKSMVIKWERCSLPHTHFLQTKHFLHHYFKIEVSSIDIYQYSKRFWFILVAKHFESIIEAYFICAIKRDLMAQMTGDLPILSASGWGSGGPRFQSHPRLTFQSCSRYQLNQLGSKAASESTFKKSNTCGISNNRLYFTLLYFTYSISTDSSYQTPPNQGFPSHNFELRELQIIVQHFFYRCHSFHFLLMNIPYIDSNTLRMLPHTFFFQTKHFWHH